MQSADRTVSKGTAVAVAGISSFTTPVMGSSINIALPDIGSELHLTAVTLGWIATSYLLSAAVFLLPFGRLADIVGRKRIYLAGIIIFTIASVVCALSGGIVELMVARVIQGLGSAMIFGTGDAILTSVFPPNERGKALGTNVAFTYVGLSLGPLVGGVLTQLFGWRAIFWAVVPLGLVSILLVVWKLRAEWAEAKGERLDLPGAVVAALSLAVLIFGLSLLPARQGIVLTASGAVGIALFVVWERRAPNPLLDMNLFASNRTFAFSNLAALIHYSATFAITFFMSLYLQYLKGESPQLAGFVLISQPAMMALFSPLTGRLSDRHDSRIIASIGIGLIGLMLALMSTIGARTPMWFIVACLLVVGIGYALFSSPNSNAIMGSVERRVYGVASATMGTMRLIGQMMSMAIALLIVSLLVGNAEITSAQYPAFVRSQKTAFLVFAVFCFFGVLASLARGKAARLAHS